MAERSLFRRVRETLPLQYKTSPRNKKRKKLLGGGMVAQQNRKALAAKTDKEATVATIKRVGAYKKAAKRNRLNKAAAKQFTSAGKAKQHKTDF